MKKELFLKAFIRSSSFSLLLNLELIDLGLEAFGNAHGFLHAVIDALVAQVAYNQANQYKKR